MREGWKRVRFSEFLTQIHRPELVSEMTEVPFAGARWYAGGIYHRDTVSAVDVKTKTLNRIRRGDITYNRMWATKASFGVVHQDADGCLVTNDFPVFSVDNEIALTPFVEFLFHLPSFQAQASLAATGTTERRRLKERDFLALIVDMPPLEEQQRIVNLIGSLDDTIEAAEVVTASSKRALSDIRSAIFEAHSGSGATPLGDLAATRLGKMLSASVEASGEMAPYVRNADVQWGRINLQDLKSMPFSASDRVEFALRKDDVLVCEGGVIGRSAVVQSDITGVFFQKAIHRVRCGDRLNPHFLQSLLAHLAETGGLDDYTGGSTIPHLTGEKLRRIPVPNVSPSDQSAAVEHLSAAASVVEGAMLFADSLRAARSELLAVLLSGEHEIPESYDVDTAVQLEPAA